MKKVFPKEILKLENAVAPEAFAVKDGTIYYFDRINKYEGRFCKLDKEIGYLETEVDESQGVLTHEGEQYLININSNNTKIEKLDEKGQRKRIINLEGIFFDLRKNETDNYVCLGNVNSLTIIKIFNEEGRILKDISPKNIIFGSSIYLLGDYIYLGAVDVNNNFKVFKLNYLGNIEEFWDIKVNSENRIINKICIYNNYIFMLVEGRSTSLALFERTDGSIKEIFPHSLGVSSIIDFDIYNDTACILDGGSIHTFMCDDIIGIEGSKAPIKLGLDIEFLYYRYHIYFKGLKDQIKHSLFEAFIPFILIFIFLYDRLFQYINGFNLIRLALYLYIIICYFIASIKNTFTLGRKEPRIEYLLNSCKECDLKKDFGVPLFFGLTSFAMVEFGMYPYADIIVSLLVLLSTGLLFYGMDYLCIKNIRAMNRHMVVELLEDSDMQTFDYIKKVVESLRLNHAEKFYIEIVSGKRVDERSLSRWKNSRNYILGQNIIVNVRDNKIIAEMDLSKRNIKYSRFSIIMDYVCFIKSIGQIKEIQVEYEKKHL